ncbi:MAG: TlpA family protein disulfide reductase [Rhodospirillales bacterium]|nr:TlpA family protein disulfide reductase [Rhodospirillales bacterium]MBI2977280.1 TlpA family protein disulfide reductase [Rhodospirillales bacterium]
MIGSGQSLRTVVAAGAAVLLILWSAGGVATEPANDPPRFQGRVFPFTTIRPAQPAPTTPLHTLSGGLTHLGRFAGKVVLLNIWATWCPPCVYELPSLQRLQAALGGDRFTVIALSVDERGADDVLPYLERLGLRGLPVYLDPAGRMAEALKVHEGLPWTFVIDHRGRVMGYLKGIADWASPEARALIRYYVDRAGD